MKAHYSVPGSHILYVIGNGFDMHYGIPSGLPDFKEYVASHSNTKGILDTIKRYLQTDNEWKTLETSLASLDLDLLIEDAENFLVSYGADDWSDSYHHAYGEEISENLSNLTFRLKEAFADWLNDLWIPDSEIILELPIGSRYLTFNYTPTLQQLHGIPESNVLHIHGRREVRESIVLGHGVDPESITSLNEGIDDPGDPRVYNGNADIDDYFQQSHKQTAKILEKNTAFFRALGDISEVYVLGHSLADIDIPYFKAILAQVHAGAQWHVSYYKPCEQEAHRRALVDIGVDSTRIDMIRMEHLPRVGTIRVVDQ